MERRGGGDVRGGCGVVFAELNTVEGITFTLAPCVKQQSMAIGWGIAQGLYRLAVLRMPRTLPPSAGSTVSTESVRAYLLEV